MKTSIVSTKAPNPVGPYSQAIMWNDLLFISGQIPLNPATGEKVSGDIRIQTNQVMENIACILSEAGMTLENILNVTLFLKKLDDFQVVNEVYGRFFTHTPPARTTVEVTNLPKNVDIEIAVIAGK